MAWLARVDRDVLADLAPQPTRLGEALTALATAAVTLQARVAPNVPAWTLIGQITRGRLVARTAPTRRLRFRSRRVLARPQPDGTLTMPNPPSQPRFAPA